MAEIEIVGRSSSHFSRTVRIFALELGVAHSFRPVFDLTGIEAAPYGGNAALKIPNLMTEDGPWFGTENICRELARRATRPGRVLLRGDGADRLVANAEELTLQAMTTEVAVVMMKMAGAATPPKLTESLTQSLAWLDAQVDRVLTLLPEPRILSFFETSLYCLVTHLPFRDVMQIGNYPRLVAHCDRFGEREAARQTSYKFDVA
jgi:glutathione S-transferase